MKATNRKGGPGSLSVRRLPVTFRSDFRRVITRFFNPGGEARIAGVMARVQALSDGQVNRLLDEVFLKFRTRHGNIAAVLDENYRMALEIAGQADDCSRNRRMLIGAYLTAEYSIESAALFNPSIVPHLNQHNIPAGAVRIIMSLRATGEGHVSSIVFRTGVIYSDHQIQIDPCSRFTKPVRVVPDKQFDKPLFRRTLLHIGVHEEVADLVLNRLGDLFTLAQLEHAITEGRAAAPGTHSLEESLQDIRWLGLSNYQLELPREAEASELVIFPQTSNEKPRHRGPPHGPLRGGRRHGHLLRHLHGLRRLSRAPATDRDPRLPADRRTHDQRGLRRNKGMALFPRRIGGHYVMCSRIDGENLYIMYSDIVHFWETAQLLDVPRYPWGLVQIGNCGSPLETPEGWLLLTHGVGPMRTYCIGAMLLDLNDPLKVIGCLDEPLIAPTERERDGYVPNVAYSCGAMIHNENLYLPFATSDMITRFAIVSLDSLLNRLMG